MAEAAAGTGGGRVNNRIKHQPPTRELLSQLWADDRWTVRAIASRFRVSETTVGGWAKRFGLGFKRNTRPVFAKKRKREYFNDSMKEEKDGPLPGDPTPEEITELAAYVIARRIMSKRVVDHD
jgi:transposase